VARLGELTKGAVVRGQFGEHRLRIVDVAWHGAGAITLTYTDELTGKPGQELLYRDDEPRLSMEQAGRVCLWAAMHGTSGWRRSRSGSPSRIFVPAASVPPRR
jgi:hypothetical protein